MVRRSEWRVAPTARTVTVVLGSGRYAAHCSSCAPRSWLGGSARQQRARQGRWSPLLVVVVATMMHNVLQEQE